MLPTLLFIFLVCTWGEEVNLSELTYERGDRIQVFFDRYLNELKVAGLFLHGIEKRDYLLNVDILSTLTRVNSSDNTECLVLEDSNRSVDYGVSAWSGTRLYNTNTTYEKFSTDFIPSARDLDTFCFLHHPPNKYQPAYCRNKQKYNNDILDFITKFLLNAESLIHSLYESGGNDIPYYFCDITGSYIYDPAIQLCPILGGSFVFPMLWFGSEYANPDRLPVYSPPYVDPVSSEFIVTAEMPIYLGDSYLWGWVLADITVSDCIKQLNDSFIPNSTLTILVEPINDVVILTNNLANVKFFNFSSENTFDVIKITEIKEFNFSSIWDSIKTGKQQAETFIDINNVPYVLAYSYVRSLKNSVLIDIVPLIDIYPKLVRHPVTLHLDNIVSWVIFALSLFFCLVPIAIGILVFIFRNHRTIHRASPPFCILSMFGAFLLNLSPIFLTTPVSSCMTWVWFLAIGFVLYFGSLLIKTYRIERIFTIGNRFKKASGLTNKELFPGVAVLLCIEIVILVIWSGVSPLVLLVEPTGITDLSVSICTPLRNGNTMWGFVGAQFIYCIFLIISTCFYSFKTRNIKMKEFREAKEILFAVYNFTLVIIICVIIAVIFRNDPTIYVAIIGIGTIFGTTVSSVVWLGLKLIKLARGNESTEESTDEESAKESKLATVNNNQGVATQ